MGRAGQIGSIDALCPICYSLAQKRKVRERLIVSRQAVPEPTSGLGKPLASCAAQWWQGYGDPQLDRLIAEALAGSPDIAIAVARVRTAEGVVQQAGAANRPTLDAEVAVGLNKQSYNNGIPAEFVPRGWNSTRRLALNAGLDLDLFGRNRASLVAATSDAEAARLEGAQAALTLATDLAARYANLARLYAEQDVLQRAVAVRGATEKLVANGRKWVHHVRTV